MVQEHSPENCPGLASLRATVAERTRVEGELRDDLRAATRATTSLERTVVRLEERLAAVPLQAAAAVAPVERQVEDVERQVGDVARTRRRASAAARWLIDKALALAAVLIALLALLSRSPEPPRQEPLPAAAAPATTPITAAGLPAAPGRSP